MNSNSHSCLSTGTGSTRSSNRTVNSSGTSNMMMQDSSDCTVIYSNSPMYDTTSIFPVHGVAAVASGYHTFRMHNSSNSSVTNSDFPVHDASASDYVCRTHDSSDSSVTNSNFAMSSASSYMPSRKYSFDSRVSSPTMTRRRRVTESRTATTRTRTGAVSRK